MTEAEKAVWLWLSSIGGMFLCFIVGAVWLPGLAKEKNRVFAMRSQINSLLLEEAQLIQKLDSLQSQMKEFRQLTQRNNRELEKATFPIKPDSAIPQFVEDLQKILVIPSLNVLNLSYRTKEVQEQFVTLFFEIRCESNYPALRNLLYQIENFRYAIHIDNLEFNSLENERHLLLFSIQCSIRFKLNA